MHTIDFASIFKKSYMKLILFDIDGTLVDTGGAGSSALNTLFREYFSLEDAFRNINMSGKTDPQIIREGLAAHNLPHNEDIIVELTEGYLAFLSMEINNDRKRTMPGVKEALHVLMNENGLYCLGLLTGNIERGARIKLGAFDLNKYFPFGAFGSDDEDRNKLLPHAVNRFRMIYKNDIDFSNCVIVGDTPRDIDCAKPYGAFSIAVATGYYSSKRLRDAGADVVMDDLSNTQEFLKSLKGLFK